MANEPGNWSMSFDSVPSGRFKIPDVAVMTLETSGAIRFAPRTVTCWIAREQLAVRSSTGEVIWIKDSNASTNPDDAVIWISSKAPEVEAMRDLFSACAWFGVDPAALTKPDAAELLGRSVSRYHVADAPGGRFASIAMTEDDESGAILELTANSSAHGPLRLTATSFAIVPWSPSYFAQPG